MRKRALVVGVSGQDGALLARLLSDKGYELHGTSRDVAAMSTENLDRVGVDPGVLRLHSMAPADFSQVQDVLARVAPDEVYLLAGQSSVGRSFDRPRESFEGIAIAAVNILEVVRKLRPATRVFNAGSGECFGELADGATESTAFRPRNPYAAAKASAHWSVASYRDSHGLYACTGILFNHESPLRPPRFVTKKVVAAACRIAAGARERLALGTLEVERDWGWAPEYVQAMWLMLQRDAPEDLVIASGVAHPLREFVRIAFEAVGLDWRAHVDVDEGLKRSTDVARSRGEPSRAASVLDWRARRGMEEVVRLMVAAEQGGSWPTVADC